MDVAAHKNIAVTVGRRHRVVIAPVAHQRQRGDSRGHLLAGVVRRRQRHLQRGKVALQPLADRPVMTAQTVSHSTAAAFQQIGVQRLEALEHRDWYEEVASRDYGHGGSPPPSLHPRTRSEQRRTWRESAKMLLLTPRRRAYSAPVR